MLNKDQNTEVKKQKNKVGRPKVKCQITGLEGYTLMDLGDVRTKEFYKLKETIKELRKEIILQKLKLVELNNKLKGIKLHKHGVKGVERCNCRISGKPRQCPIHGIYW